MDQIATYLPGILLAYAAFLLSIMSPGPNVLSIMGTSMSIGRRTGVSLAMGVAAGSFVWAVLTAAGLSALIASYAIVLTVIKIVGGLFLLWLAYKAFKSAASAHEIVAQKPDDATRNRAGFFLRGFTIQMTNPKAALAWIAIISLGLSAQAPFWVAFAVVAGTTLMSVVIHLLYALAFSTPPMVRLYAKTRRWVQGTLGIFFTFAGLKLLTSKT